MKKISLLKMMLLAVVMMVGSVNVWGDTAVYTVASTTSVTSSGATPSGSNATYSQTYSATSQITSGNSATLTLSGYAGYKITRIVLNMRSNGSGGSGTLSVVAGSTTIASVSPTAAFNTSSWNGAWSTTYVDITKTPTAYNIQTGENVVITISATANSLYIAKYTIEYETAISDPRTVTFNYGTGVGGTPSITSGSPITLPTASPSAECVAAEYEFAGWTTSAATPTSTTTWPVFVTSPYIPTGDITLYAVYKKADGNDSYTFTRSSGSTTTDDDWIFSNATDLQDEFYKIWGTNYILSPKINYSAITSITALLGTFGTVTAASHTHVLTISYDDGTEWGTYEFSTSNTNLTTPHTITQTNSLLGTGRLKFSKDGGSTSTCLRLKSVTIGYTKYIYDSNPICTPTLVVNPSTTEISSYSANNNIYLNNLPESSSIYVYNVAGQLVTSQKTSASNAVLPVVQKGVLIVKVVSAANTSTIKILNK